MCKRILAWTITVLVCWPALAGAQDATWLLTPADVDWNNSSNWTGGSVPTGVATFGATTQRSVTISDFTTIGSLVFAAGAPQYAVTIDATNLFVQNAGIVNLSSDAPTFHVTNSFGFGGGFINFFNSASAGNGIYTIDQNSSINFLGSSTADTATFYVNSDSLTFANNSTAANANIISAGRTGFVDSSTLGNATVHVLDGGELTFSSDATGGTGRIITDVGGITDVSGANNAITLGSIEGGGTYLIGNGHPLTVGSNNLSTTVSGDIIDCGGCGSLIKVGTGTLTLTGNNSYSGGTTVVAGTLAGTTNGLQGDIVNNATLQFDQTFDGTYAGALTGTGTVVKSGSGAVTFSSSGNTYTGATQVLAGTLLAGAVDAFGTLSAVTVASGATLDLNGNDQALGSLAGGGMVTFGSGASLTVGANNTDATFGGSISGVGVITKTGSGSWFLTGDNSGFTGVMAVNRGTLVGSATSLPGLIFDDAAVRFDQANDGTYSGEVDGIGTVSKTGAGTLTLNGPNSYAGGTTLSAGLVAISDPTSLGTGTITFNGGGLRLTAPVTFTQTLALGGGGGTLDTTAAGSSTITQAIGGTGGLTKTGDGTLTLTGANNYTGGTTVNGGTLVGTTTSLQGAIVNNATVQFDQNTNGTYASAMSGIGTLIKTGSGTLTLTGANSYSGATTVSAGTLQSGAANTFSSASAMTVAGGATVDLNGFNQTIGSLAGAGAVTLGSATLTTGADGTSTTFDGTIAGSGGLTKIGGGTLTLTGANSYTGGTIVDGGTLVGTTTSLQGTIVNNAAVEFAQPSDGTYSGVMSGAGSFTKSGGGTLTLAGANSYTGATVISGGMLRAGALNAFGSASATTIASGATLDLNGFAQTIGSLAGTGGVTLGSAMLTTGADGTSTTFDGTIAGTGGLTKIGGGMLTLTGANSYTGGTIVSGGALAGTTTSLQGPIVNNAAVIFNQGADGTYAGGMSGSGVLVKSGGGMLTLAGANTYTGGTVVSGGTLAGTTSTLQGPILDNATVAFDQATDGMFAGSLSGSGSLIKSGSGIVALAGTNTYSGGTLVNGGALAGTTTSLQGSIVNNAAVVFDQTLDGTYAGVMSGSGALIKSGSGTVTLAGANTYSGGTVVAGGTLAGNTTTLQGTIVDNAAVTFAQTTSGAFLGTLGGTGSLTKTGAGTLTLAGAQPLTGLATVAQGTLALGGAFGGSLLVNAGATLTVTASSVGAAPASSTHRGITVASAGAGSTSTITGDLTFAPGSTYRVTIGGDGSAPLLVAGGTAHLNGSTVDISFAQPPSTRVIETVLVGGIQGLTGTVAVNSHVAAIDPVVSSVGNALVLSLLNMNAPLAPAATTSNGAHAGAAIDRIKAGASGDLGEVVRELTALDDDSLASTLTSAAGEIHASDVQLAALDVDAITGVAQDRMTVRRDGRERASAASANWTPGRQWWSTLVGETASFDATSDAHGGDASLGGFAVGMDQAIGSGWLVGLGGSYERGSLTLDGTTASSRFSAPQLFAYAGRTAGVWTARAGGGVGWAAYDTTRQMAFAATLAPVFGGQLLFGGINRTATSAPRGLTTNAWGDLQAQTIAGAWALQPRVGLRYAHFGEDAWQETAAGALSLSAPAQAEASAQAEGGLRAARIAGRFVPYGVLTYRRELTDGATTTTVQLTDSPAGQFAIDGITFARDTVVAGGGLQLPLGRSALSISYQLRRAAGQTRQAASLGIGF